jgi:hypothetical protein
LAKAPVPRKRSSCASVRAPSAGAVVWSSRRRGPADGAGRVAAATREHQHPDPPIPAEAPGLGRSSPAPSETWRGRADADAAHRPEPASSLRGPAGAGRGAGVVDAQPPPRRRIASDPDRVLRTRASRALAVRSRPTRSRLQRAGPGRRAHPCVCARLPSQPGSGAARANGCSLAHPRAQRARSCAEVTDLDRTDRARSDDRLRYIVLIVLGCRFW